jgi:hypothetical protein
MGPSWRSCRGCGWVRIGGRRWLRSARRSSGRWPISLGSESRFGGRTSFPAGRRMRSPRRRLRRWLRRCPYRRLGRCLGRPLRWWRRCGGPVRSFRRGRRGLHRRPWLRLRWVRGWFRSGRLAWISRLRLPIPPLAVLIARFSLRRVAPSAGRISRLTLCAVSPWVGWISRLSPCAVSPAVGRISRFSRCPVSPSAGWISRAGVLRRMVLIYRLGLSGLTWLHPRLGPTWPPLGVGRAMRATRSRSSGLAGGRTRGGR